MLADSEIALFDSILKASETPYKLRQRVLEGDPEVSPDYENIGEELGINKQAFDLSGRQEKDRPQFESDMTGLRARTKAVLDAAETKILLELRDCCRLAFGVATPVRPDSKHKVIIPVLWATMNLQFKEAHAVGGGNEFKDVRISDIADLTESEWLLLQSGLRKLIDQEVGRTEKQKEPQQTVGARIPRESKAAGGAPTKNWDAYAAELHRYTMKEGRGVSAKVICGHLYKWGLANLPKRQQAKLSSIGKRLSQLYGWPPCKTHSGKSRI